MLNDHLPKVNTENSIWNGTNGLMRGKLFFISFSGGCFTEITTYFKSESTTYQSIVSRQLIDSWSTVTQLCITITLYISVESYSIFWLKNVDTKLICHRLLVDYWSIASWQSIEGLSKHINTSLINYFSDSQVTLQQNRIKLLESWWKFNKCLQVLWMVFLQFLVCTIFLISVHCKFAWIPMFLWEQFYNK